MYCHLTHVLVVIQNDAGVNRTIYGMFAPPDTSHQIFTSFMKARIFCKREVPDRLLNKNQILGAQDFRYDEMCKIAELLL